MKIALISDVHGNIYALNAVLADAAAHGADTYVFLGDYIFDFPFSSSVVDRLMGLKNARFVAGNKEGYLRAFDWDDPNGLAREQTAVLYQSVRELSPYALAFLKELPESLTIRLDSGRTLHASHTLKNLRRHGRTRYNSSHRFREDMFASPFSHAEYLEGLKAFYAREMGEEIRAIGADVVAYGHNHLQGYGDLNGALLVDAGSCGLPADFDTRAAYTLLEETNDGLRAIEKRVPYDREACVRAARQTQCYQRGRIWSEVTYRTLLCGWDCASAFLRIARGGALPANGAAFFENDEMERAYGAFLRAYFPGEWEKG